MTWVLCFGSHSREGHFTGQLGGDRILGLNSEFIQQLNTDPPLRMDSYRQRPKLPELIATCDCAIRK